MKKILTLLLVILACNGLYAQDSTKSYLQILPRLHSAAYFPFTGALLNRNPVFDVNVYYDSEPAARKSWGFFVFQSFDLKDRRSYVNYLQPGLFATLKLHPTFKVRGVFGYIFSQTEGFRDKDSDYYAAARFMWDPNKHLSIGNTLLYFDFTIRQKLANRFSIAWSSDKFRAEFFLWDRVVLDEKRHAVSASVAVTFPNIKVGERTAVQITSAYMWYLTSYRPSFALADGFVFTLGVPVDVIK
jgi:hypothetical protein